MRINSTLKGIYLERETPSTAPTGGRLPPCVGVGAIRGFRGSVVGGDGRKGLVKSNHGREAAFSVTHGNTAARSKKREVCKYWRNGGMPSVLSTRRRVGEKGMGSEPGWGVGVRLWICGSTMGRKRRQTAWLSQIRDDDADFPLPTETQGDGKKKLLA